MRLPVRSFGCYETQAAKPTLDRGATKISFGHGCRSHLLANFATNRRTQPRFVGILSSRIDSTPVQLESSDDGVARLGGSIALSKTLNRILLP
jgi:hypothetical protein